MLRLKVKDSINSNMDNITVTNAAFDKVKDLLADPDFVEPGTEALRVFIQGGGCSGFKYGFVFEPQIKEDDEIVERDGVKIVIDPMSLMYLSGSTIDYKRSLSGDQFTIENPQTTSTCGCGSSFSV